MRYLLPLFFLLFSVSNAFALDYWVDNLKGNDKNPGSKEQPFASMHVAVSKLRPGDTMNLVKNDVPYRELLYLNNKSGNEENPIVIHGNGAVISGEMPAPKGSWKKTDKWTDTWTIDFTVAEGADREFLLKLDELGVFLNGTYCDLRKKERFEKKPSPYLGFFEDGTFTVQFPNDFDPNGVETSFFLFKHGIRIRGGTSWFVVKDLIVERVSSDGVNLHGSCKDMLFDNIEVRWVGFDDRRPGKYGMNSNQGFTSHGTCEAVFKNCYVHHCPDAVVDINQCVTVYENCVFKDNLSKGVWLFGKRHVLKNSVFENNGNYYLNNMPLNSWLKNRLEGASYAPKAEARSSSDHGADTTDILIEGNTFKGGARVGVVLDLENVPGKIVFKNNQVMKYEVETFVTKGKPEMIQLEGNKIESEK